MSRTLFGLALLCLVACTLVAGQCTYDRSPDRDYVTGKVILRDTSDKNPGGAHGPGGSTLKDGFCIDEKDNSLKCQGQAQPIVGLFECSKGQLCCHNTYKGSLPVSNSKYPPNTCYLNKRDKNGQFMKGKCAQDKWGVCDQVGAMEPLSEMDNCPPGSGQCCEYLKGEFEAEQSKIRAAAAERRAAEQAAAAKAAAEQKAAAQQAAAAEAARQKAADDAALAAAKSRKPEPIMGCNYVTLAGRLQSGSCVRHRMECPGGIANEDMMGSIGTICLKQGYAACCKTGSRLPGAEEAERKATADVESARIDADIARQKAAKAAQASVAQAKQQQVSGGKAIGCVGFKGMTPSTGVCAVNAGQCQGESISSGSIQDYPLTCGKLDLRSENSEQPVCCLGKLLTPGIVQPKPLAEAAPAVDDMLKQGKIICRYPGKAGKDLVGYCSPSNALCPDENNFGTSTTTVGFDRTCGYGGKRTSVCCGIPDQPQDEEVINTVCPLPTVFVEESVEIEYKPTAVRFAEKRMRAQADADATPKKSAAAGKKASSSTKKAAAPKAKSSKKVTDPTKMTPKQKAHCAAERRAYLAAKARKGDRKAAETLMKESKTLAKKGKTAASKPKAATKPSAAKPAAAKKPAAGNKKAAGKSKQATLAPKAK